MELAPNHRNKKVTDGAKTYSERFVLVFVRRVSAQLNINVRNNGKSFVSGPPPPPSALHSPPDLTINTGPAFSLLISVLIALFLHGGGGKVFSPRGNKFRLQRDPLARGGGGIK